MDLSPQTAFQPYQTDVLFLLIGANPLPNYVAACLLARPDATLYLLHSEEDKGTYDIADRLKRALADCRPDLNILLRGIPRADPRVINTRMEGLLENVPPAADVGLNYTGGTKPMAVHVYHVLRQAFPRGCFSYLDAADLKLVINQGTLPTQYMPVGRQVELDFRTLFAMHGYELDCPRPTANQPQFCRALAQVHTTSEGGKQWYNWRKTLATPSRQFPDSTQYPALRPVIQGFVELCGGQPPTEGLVARALGFDRFESCFYFFKGKWLEEYTFDALAGLVEPLQFRDHGKALKAMKPGRERPLELDVAAMWGYQLFAVSCIVTDDPQKAKDHLFEVFVRARQVGGDEARSALVCCVKNPTELQVEVEETWDAEGKIRVFGQTQLLDLPTCLKDWFRTANREVP